VSGGHPAAAALRVAVVGGGIAGSALALLLARRGARVVLFDDGRRRELVVGESLVPAAVPLLRRLGAEADAAALGVRKPGVSFVWSGADRASFTFARFAPAVPAYAYNVPRPAFDEALLARALAAGVVPVRAAARLEPAAAGAGGPELRLAPESLAAAPALDGRQPDLIVDASGRARRAARALGIGARVGPRRDVAHFAHFAGCRWDDEPGQVVIGRAAAGWTWCIPLRERLSIGIVVGQEDARRLGRAPADRLAAAIARDARLSAIAGDARRVTGVATYANYQLVSTRGHGAGWVMVGDAFGFVDPMLSPGVFLALHSAALAARALDPVLTGRAPASPRAVERALAPYARTMAGTLRAWADLVEYLYDGRLMALVRAGRGWLGARPGPVKRRAQHHIERHVALQASGVATTSRYSRGLLRFLGRHGVRDVDPGDLAIR